MAAVHLDKNGTIQKLVEEKLLSGIYQIMKTSNGDFAVAS